MEELSSEQRQEAARRIIENAHGYYVRRARHRHIGINPEWIERVLTDPYHVEVEPNGRFRYWGYIAEWDETGRWLRVVVEDGRLFNAFPDRNKMTLWGIT